MIIIQYTDDGQIIAEIAGSERAFFVDQSPVLNEPATRQRVVLATEWEKVSPPTATKRYYVEEADDNGLPILQVRDKTEVTLSIDVTEIDGDDTDAATLTLDSTEEVVLLINGEAQEKQAYPSGIVFTSDDPRQYVFEINDARHWSNEVELLVRHIIPG